MEVFPMQYIEPARPVCSTFVASWTLTVHAHVQLLILVCVYVCAYIVIDSIYVQQLQSLAMSHCLSVVVVCWTVVPSHVGLCLGQLLGLAHNNIHIIIIVD